MTPGKYCLPRQQQLSAMLVFSLVAMTTLPQQCQAASINKLLYNMDGEYYEHFYQFSGFDVVLTKQLFDGSDGTGPHPAANTPAHICRGAFTALNMAKLLEENPAAMAELKSSELHKQAFMTGDLSQFVWNKQDKAVRPYILVYTGNKTRAAVKRPEDRDFPVDQYTFVGMPVSEPSTGFSTQIGFIDGKDFNPDSGSVHWDTYGKFPFACIRKTNKGKTQVCGDITVMLFSNASLHMPYNVARDSCLNEIGFHMATAADLDYLRTSTVAECSSLVQIWQDSVWINKAQSNSLSGVKPAICVGCQISYKHTVGMAGINRAGRVQCLPGYLPTPPLLPPRCENGSWVPETLATCTRYMFKSGGDTYGILAMNEFAGQLVPAQASTYANATQQCRTRHDSSSTLPIVSNAADLAPLQDLLASWNNVWYFIHYQNASITPAMISLVSYNSWPNSPPSAAVAAAKTKWAVCMTSCVAVETRGRMSADALTGFVTCQPGYYWSCSGGPCTRNPRHAVPPVCKDDEWLNLPTCAAGSPSVPTGYDSSNAVIDATTSSFHCAPGFYERCTLPNCAGGINNTAATARTVNGALVWNNLPTCHKFDTFECGVSTYLTGQATSLSNARRSCLDADTVLLSDHYLRAMTPGNRGCLLGRPRPIWLFPTHGEGEVFNGNDTVMDFVSASLGAYDFVCLPHNYSLIMAASAPEVSSMGERLRCKTEPETYICNASVVIRGNTSIICLPHCTKPVPSAPKSIICSGYNVSVNHLATSYSLARQVCKDQGNTILKSKVISKFRTFPCFSAEIAVLTKNGASSIWTRYTNKKPGRYSLQTNSTDLIYSQTRARADAFICALDVDECATGPCGAGNVCRNTKGSYVCTASASG
ncbi:uncharacterized protein LOC135827361 [Sycon ciliatum]|uniref:uncharacterized protein LOC135827361 n=1 Tax=Sycon ciliatum TaxID=27933 RepID=UPI0031F6CD11